MCRLYGFQSNEATKVECTLVHAQNALMLQSASDARGRRHADGWGLAFYHGEMPELERRAHAAFEDLHFSRTAERIYSPSVVAHVRLATVGRISPQNCHPFVFGNWTLAHNGTVTAFDRLRAELEGETDPDLQAIRAGDTDSEQLFLWLLTRLRRSGISLDDHPSSTRVADVLAAAIPELALRCAAAGGDPARLNVVLTNGNLMVAVRWKNDLFMVERTGVRDCEICGIPHIQHDEHTEYHAVVIASEAISSEAWQEVPDASVIAAEAGVVIRQTSIGG